MNSKFYKWPSGCNIVRRILVDFPIRQCYVISAIKASSFLSAQPLSKYILTDWSEVRCICSNEVTISLSTRLTDNREYWFHAISKSINFPTVSEFEPVSISYPVFQVRYTLYL